jgi:hypothetical protein
MKILIISGIATTGWVCSLERDAVGELREVIAVLRGVFTDDVLEARGHEEVLLAQAEDLTGAGVVVGVKYAGDVLGDLARLDGVEIAAFVEELEVEFLRRVGLPETKRVDVIHAVTDDGRIERDSLDDFAVLGMEDAPAGLVAFDDDMSAELDENGLVEPLDRPGIAVSKPLVGIFDLVSVLDPLFEDAVAVPDAVTVSGKFEGGEGV